MKIDKLGFGLGFLAMLAGGAAQAAVTYEFVCGTPSTPTDCDGDAGLSLSVTLADSVVNANSFYRTLDDGGAGFLGWSATSSSANSAVLLSGTSTLNSYYDGFSISGGLANIVSAPSGLRFTFDNEAVLTGMTGILEEGVGTNFQFVAATGEISWTEPNRIDYRRDWRPTTYPNFPSAVQDRTPIGGYFQRVPEVGPGVIPEPATVALLAFGLAGLGFSRRRKQ